MPLDRFNVTSRKFTIFWLACTVIFNLSSLKHSVNFFLSLSAVLGPMFLKAARPSSLYKPTLLFLNLAFNLSMMYRSHYEIDKEQNEKYLRENITKSYKTAPEDSTDQINQELEDITAELNIGDRVETMAKQQAFITFKDHKDNFQNKPTCRLINPAKSNLGRVRKQIVENINDKVRSYTNANQWKNTREVINWFSGLNDKNQLSFITFDIVDFYPSISENLLTKALIYSNF